MSDEEKLFADLWVKQSDLFLKLVALVPVVQIAIVAGWYILMKDGEAGLAHAAAGMGAVAMIAAWIILRRTTQYIAHFRNQITRLLPSAHSTKLTGRWVGLFIPVVCIVLNVVLASGFVVVKPTPLQSPAAASSTKSP